MAKQQATMIMLFKKADRASATEYAEVKKFFTSDGTSASGEGVLADTIPPVQYDGNTNFLLNKNFNQSQYSTV